MNIRRLLPPLLALILAPGLGRAADAKPAAAPSGFRVVAEITFDEKGAAEEARIVQSDDPTGELFLNQVALTMARQVKQAPRLQDGKPVKFKVQAPFDFPVAFDEGPAANLGPKPVLRRAEQPVYPPSLAAQGAVGGAVIEVIIGADGLVHGTKVLQASHPEFAESVTAAVKSWVFIPALRDATPIETRWRIAFAFATDRTDVEYKWRVAPRPSMGSYLVGHNMPRPPAAPVPAPAPAPTPPPAPGK